MKKMNFIKMQGIGNDFILIDSRKEDLSDIDLSKLAQDICNRNFGVGADGLLVVQPSKKAHYRMEVWNPDGSEAEMCGNGIRCFAKYVFETDKLKEELISVETPAGIILPAVILDRSGNVIGVEVDMGEPKDEGEIQLQGFDFKKISMGNPHAIAFIKDLNDVDISEIGSIIELDSHFKNRTNVEFVKVISNKEIEVMVWERGVGITLACGTGACASVVASSLAGKTGRRVIVHLPGGNLDCEWQESDNHVIMRGPAETVFQGTYFSS